MSCYRTTVAPPSARTNLSPYLGHLDAITADLAEARRAALDRAALVVVASWRDEHARDRVGCWLRIAPPDGGPLAPSLGAHLECDVGQVLGASLRHALLVLDHDRRPGCVDVVDLRTQQGLRHEGDTSVRRVLAEGAVRFGAGTADVLAMPLAAGERMAVAVERAHAALELGVVPMAPSPAVDVASWDRSVCAPVPAPARLWRDALTHVGVALGDAPRGVCRVTVSERALAEGALLGRQDRCAGGGVDARISRVHAWVVTRGHGLLVVDLGSTNGSAVQDGPRRVALTRGRRAVACGREATILLAGVGLRLHIEPAGSSAARRPSCASSRPPRRGLRRARCEPTCSSASASATSCPCPRWWTGASTSQAWRAPSSPLRRATRAVACASHPRRSRRCRALAG